MTKITNLDKKSLGLLTPQMIAALATLGEQTGLKFEFAGGRFEGSGDEATIKVKVIVDDPVKQEAAARSRWEANCKYIGLDFNRPQETGLRPEDFGTEFVSGGTTYRTTGLALGRSKYPIEVEVLTGQKKGKRVFFTEQAVPAIRRATDAAKS
jgi:hypothetical protein